jgi:peroxin-7
MAADYTDNDRLLLSFDQRQCALTWSLEHAQELRWFVGHTGAITALASCEAQPTMLGTGSGDRTAKIWDARVRSPALTLHGHHGPVSAICLVSFDATQSFCFTGGLDEVIKVRTANKS